MTLKNNKAPLLCYFKLCAPFHNHLWIQTGVTVQKHPIWVKIDDFFSCVTLKFDGWPWKTIAHLFYATSSFVHHFIAICELKVELQSGVGIRAIQYIPRNMHTVFAFLCFVVVIHWLIFPYPSGLLHWHCGNLTIAPVPAKQPWWIWINTSCEFIMNDCITTTKQSTTKPCAYLLGYTVSNYIQVKQWDIINYPCFNFNSG